jgi:hypothetical protein
MQSHWVDFRLPPTLAYVPFRFFMCRCGDFETLMAGRYGADSLPEAAPVGALSAHRAGWLDFL